MNYIDDNIYKLSTMSYPYRYGLPSSNFRDFPIGPMPIDGPSLPPVIVRPGDRLPVEPLPNPILSDVIGPVEDIIGGGSGILPSPIIPDIPKKEIIIDNGNGKVPTTDGVPADPKPVVYDAPTKPIVSNSVIEFLFIGGVFVASVIAFAKLV